MNHLSTENVSISYGKQNIVENMNLRIHDGKITAIIGPNGSGKSTLLKAMARIKTVKKGHIYLDGESIHRLNTREVAMKLGLLFQSSSTPGGITVYDLVCRGRYPHHSLFQGLGKEDKVIIESSLELTGLSGLKDSIVDELSGGQRQRAWIAMALAQETPILMLDEPTTYLDVSHRREIIELIKKLGSIGEKTIITVLHDLNDALLLSDHVIILKNGKIIEHGIGSEIINTELLSSVFNISCDLVKSKKSDKTHLFPRSKVLNTTSSDKTFFNNKKAIQISGLKVGYGDKNIIQNLSVEIPEGKITTIIGANASGKSTLLKTIGGHLHPQKGHISILNTDINRYSSKSLALELSFLSQKEETFGEMTVEQFVSIGRYPHQEWYSRWSRKDQDAVNKAMTATSVYSMRTLLMHNLSGGEQQRVRLAGILAQESKIILLDEPTSFLDIAHQVEILDLVWELNVKYGRTIIMVLHDLWQAYRYSDFIIVIKNGRIINADKPHLLESTTMLKEAFNTDSEFIPDPQTGGSLIIHS